ncbi:hypothetical protein LTR78_003945 [Recurvomyces mirabilis]|uniref:Amidohydrolase-related domain-containing protein n=1 Tax=Recurvomyces mirabilis TaxID=574656 RepID=A0AAE1C2Z7_9PEZI|nr:hypothetical protein LTR78_003945 [Recurvomyces mirabilis]
MPFTRTLLISAASFCVGHNITRKIFQAAIADKVDLYNLPFATTALSSIQTIYDKLDDSAIPAALINATIVDLHSHIVPPWYHAIVPLSGQVPTPNWTLAEHLSFMANNSIGHSVLSISTPGSVVFPGDEAKSAALARLLNEYMAAIVYKLPKYFSFFAVTPLPYTHKQPFGTGLLSNHEGYYLGNHTFTPLFSHLNISANNKVFIHPTDPCIHDPQNSSQLLSANPSPYPSGLIEYYFETARTLADLTVTQTILNFTNLQWIVPHGGGAFPAVEDRFITSQPPAVQAGSRAAYASRCFWDVAGPVFPHQVLGLLGYGVPTKRLVYGSDFPYAPSFTYAAEIAAVRNSSLLSAEEKIGLFAGNSVI